MCAADAPRHARPADRACRRGTPSACRPWPPAGRTRCRSPCAMAARKAGAVFSMRPLALSCRPRWAIGRRNVARSSAPAPCRTRRAAVADDAPCTSLRFGSPRCRSRRLGHSFRPHVARSFAGEWTPITVLQGKGLRSALLWPRKATMTHRLLRRSLGASTGALALLAACAGGACQGRRRRHPHGPPPRRLRDVAGDGPRRHRRDGRQRPHGLRADRLGLRGLHAEHAVRHADDQSGRHRHDHRPALRRAGRRATASAFASTPASSATRSRPRSPPATRRAPTPPTTSRWS